MKVIFLDIDGVLNNEEWFIRDTSKDITVNGITMCPINSEYKSKRIEINGISCRHDIDKELVKNLKGIIDHTGAKIVLCSSWRHAPKDHKSSIYLNYIFDKHGLSIMDKTGTSMPSYRPYEIKYWLDYRNHDDVESFVILDDDYNYEDYAEFGLEKHLVQTRFYGKDGGLQLFPHVNDAIKILENNFG